jgi:hypothetical protein
MLWSRAIEETNQSFERVKMRSAAEALDLTLAARHIVELSKACLGLTIWQGTYPMSAVGQEASRI